MTVLIDLHIPIYFHDFEYYDKYMKIHFLLYIQCVFTCAVTSKFIISFEKNILITREMFLTHLTIV